MVELDAAVALSRGLVLREGNSVDSTLQTSAKRPHSTVQNRGRSRLLRAGPESLGIDTPQKEDVSLEKRSHWRSAEETEQATEAEEISLFLS